MYMKPWKLSELEAVLHCAVPVEAEITCVSTDTRDLPAGCLFVALRGEKFDGHAFVEQAIAAGAVAAVTDRQVGDCPCLVVKDTGRALQQIARFYREKFHPILVGITGSVGKTTTKEMIACVIPVLHPENTGQSEQRDRTAENTAGAGGLSSGGSH